MPGGVASGRRASSCVIRRPAKQPGGAPARAGCQDSEARRGPGAPSARRPAGRPAPGAPAASRAGRSGGCDAPLRRLGGPRRRPDDPCAVAPRGPPGRRTVGAPPRGTSPARVAPIQLLLESTRLSRMPHPGTPPGGGDAPTGTPRPRGGAPTTSPF